MSTERNVLAKFWLARYVHLLFLYWTFCPSDFDSKWMDCTSIQKTIMQTKNIAKCLRVTFHLLLWPAQQCDTWACVLSVVKITRNVLVSIGTVQQPFLVTLATFSPTLSLRFLVQVITERCCRHAVCGEMLHAVLWSRNYLFRLRLQLQLVPLNLTYYW
jgi:hypothetical protein